jgi:A/G-specific adenine glycosylase
VDGNVYRVLSRFFGIHTPIDTTIGVKKFEELAQSLISQEQPGNYNQAVMELGALVCTPKKPKCDNCVLNQNCFSFEKKSADSLPVKSKKIKKLSRFFYYFDIRVSSKYLIKKRENNKDIWCGLYELPLIETDKKINGLPRVINIFCSKYGVEKNSIKTNGKIFHLKHVLTHQTIHAFFIRFSLTSPNQKLLEKYKVLGENSMKKYPFPRLLEKYFQKK